MYIYIYGVEMCKLLQYAVVSPAEAMMLVVGCCNNAWCVYWCM